VRAFELGEIGGDEERRADQRSAPEPAIHKVLPEYRRELRASPGEKPMTRIARLSVLYRNFFIQFDV
jgi:hypothetical protein